MKNLKKSCFETWKLKKNSGSYKQLKAKLISEQFGQNGVRKTLPPPPAPPPPPPPPPSFACQDLTPQQYVNPSDEDEEIQFFSNGNNDGAETKKDFDIRLIEAKISCWAIKTNVNHNQLKGLLEIWNNNVPLPSLPHDPRTILRTPRTLKITTDGKQQYWHYGLKKSLLNILSLSHNVPDSISLLFNVDGLPISGSSKQQFWPILYTIYEMKHVPAMTIGIFYGYEKPSSLERFLRSFVDEIKLLLDYGIDIREKNVAIKIRCFVADSPARAFLKAVVNFNATEGCIKCTVEGYRSPITNATIFPNLNAPKRTDQDFRAGVYVDHCKATTPLLELPIDMIQDFVIGDVLHLIDLGITKWLIKSWSKGFFPNVDAKWSSSTTNQISEFLVSCEKPPRSGESLFTKA